MHPETTISTDEKNTLTIKGALKSNQLSFEGKIWIKTDGVTESGERGYRIRKASKVDIYISVGTAYKNDHPDYTGNDYQAANIRAISKAQSSSFEELLAEHVADYGTLFNRVSLTVGKSAFRHLPTNERQLLYAKGGEDPGLEALYFQYGRYLLISSSRPGTLPANLQGAWNHELNAPWACDYHMNINFQMNYWPAEVTQLPECHEPFIEYIDKLRTSGRITAKEYFNARGWNVHTMNNIFGYTAPGWSFYWGYAPTAPLGYAGIFGNISSTTEMSNF